MNRLTTNSNGSYKSAYGQNFFNQRASENKPVSVNAFVSAPIKTKEIENQTIEVNQNQKQVKEAPSNIAKINLD